MPKICVESGRKVGVDKLIVIGKNSKVIVAYDVQYCNTVSVKPSGRAHIEYYKECIKNRIWITNSNDIDIIYVYYYRDKKLPNISTWQDVVGYENIYFIQNSIVTSDLE